MKLCTTSPRLRVSALMPWLRVSALMPIVPRSGFDYLGYLPGYGEDVTGACREGPLRNRRTKYD